MYFRHRAGIHLTYNSQWIYIEALFLMVSIVALFISWLHASSHRICTSPSQEVVGDESQGLWIALSQYRRSTFVCSTLIQRSDRYKFASLLVKSSNARETKTHSSYSETSYMPAERYASLFGTERWYSNEPFQAEAFIRFFCLRFRTAKPAILRRCHVLLLESLQAAALSSHLHFNKAPRNTNSLSTSFDSRKEEVLNFLFKTAQWLEVRSNHCTQSRNSTVVDGLVVSRSRCYLTEHNSMSGTVM